MAGCAVFDGVQVQPITKWLSPAQMRELRYSWSFDDSGRLHAPCAVQPVNDRVPRGPVINWADEVTPFQRIPQSFAGTLFLNIMEKVVDECIDVMTDEHSRLMT